MQVARRLQSLAAAATVTAAASSALWCRTDARTEGRVTPARHHWPTPLAAAPWASRLPLHTDVRQRYCVDSVIGQGGFGLVHQGRDKRSDARVAIKRVGKKTTSKAKFLQEVDILRAVGGRHHVVSLCEAFETADAYVLVTELVDGQELFAHLVEHGVFDERRAQTLVRDVASALAYLHEHGVVHGDLKPENILVQSDDATALRVKLIDFGQSFRQDVATERSRCVGSGVATMAYAAPEVLVTAKNAGSAIDLWGLGVVLYILLCGFHPFDPESDATDAELAKRISAGAFDTTAPEWTALPAAARDLIERLLQVDPTLRPSADEVLQHAWLQGVAAA